MLGLHPFHLRAFESREDVRHLTFTVLIHTTDTAFHHDETNQLRGDDENFVPMFDCCVFEIRMNGDSKVCRNGPRSCGPDDK